MILGSSRFHHNPGSPGNIEDTFTLSRPQKSSPLLQDLGALAPSILFPSDPEIQHPHSSLRPSNLNSQPPRPEVSPGAEVEGLGNLAELCVPPGPNGGTPGWGPPWTMAVAGREVRKEVRRAPAAARGLGEMGVQTQKVCGAQTSSRASRRPWPSTRHVAGGKSSCLMKARCMVSLPLSLALPPTD